MAMALWCVLVLFSCQQYSSVCPFGFYVLAAMAPLCAVQACTMMAISHALALVERLSLDELAPETMKRSTKRWGWISKNCPGFSRVNHLIICFIALVGLAVAGGVCKAPSPDDQCQPPLSSPSAPRDFGVLFAMWVAVAVFGLRAISKNSSLPHIHEPRPEDPSKVVGQACTFMKLCHP